MSKEPGKKILILDYGMGNLQSVRRKLSHLGVNAEISKDFRQLKWAEKIILPGVGHFGKAMENIRKLDLLEALNEAVLNHRKPILGICLGMQLMARQSEEGDATGLGWINADVVRFRMADPVRHKVPHIGWNSLTKVRGKHPLLAGLDNDVEMYFVHSYHVKCNQHEHVLTTTDYGNTFHSAFANGNIMGVQFHPEKSHHWGELMLSNFIKI